MSIGLTAFPGLSSKLNEGIKNSLRNSDGIGDFKRLITRCDGSCMGMCCYDGGYIEPEEEEILTNIIRKNKAELSTWVTLPDRYFEKSRWPTKGRQTALRKHEFPSSAALPKHFNTGYACFLLTRTGKCALELLAREFQHHKWYYKPICCWLFPIVAEHDGDRMFHLFSERDEPYKSDSYPGFVSYAICSKTNLQGFPARKVLRDELDYVFELLIKSGYEDTAKKLGEELCRQCH